MRLALLVVFLCSVSVALCQSPQPGLLNPTQPQVAPPAFQFPGKDFSNTPPTWRNSSMPGIHVRIVPPGHNLRPPVEPQIDPDIIIHPPKSRLSQEPQGSLVAQNIYPGLRFLPINYGKPIPTNWPKAKIESIPIEWPALKMLPVDNDSSAAKSAPAN